MKETADYLINFSIPQSPTGPTGPGTENNICFASYEYRTTNGNLRIESSRVIPIDSKTYTIEQNRIIVEAGLYEITYCGTLQKNGGSNSQVTLNLQVTSNNGSTTVLPDMGIHLDQNANYTIFSNTAIFDIPQRINLQVYLVQFNSTSIESDSVNVIIKKLG